MMKFKHYIALYALQLAERFGASVISKPHKELLAAALREVTKAESLHPEQSGEFRRHQVYAALLKKFPRELKREIGFAIEVALRGD